MGHQSHYSKQVLEALIARLDQYQIGAPATPEMFEILSILFKEEEAHIGSCFPVGPTTLESLAKKTGRSPELLEPQLESMAEKGLVMDQVLRGRRFYMLVPTLIGFFEFTFMRLNQELPYKRLADLMERLFNKAMAKEFFSSRTPMTRALVQEKALAVISSTVLPYEQVSELIRSSDTISIQACYCRRKANLLEHECKVKAPVEGVCMGLGRVADFLVRRGFARAAGKDEMLRVLDDTEKMGLMHVTDNVREDPAFICHCCGCCCELLGGINRYGYDGALNHSRFQTIVIEEKCNGCGVCAEYCHIKALSLKGEDTFLVTVDTSKCLGCGVCISRCAQDALTLIERPEKPRIPKNYIRRHLAITRQKGRLHHSIGYLTGAAVSGEFLDFFKSQGGKKIKKRSKP